MAANFPPWIPKYESCSFYHSSTLLQPENGNYPGGKKIPEQRESNGKRILQIGVRSLKLRKIKSPLYSKHKAEHTPPRFLSRATLPRTGLGVIHWSEWARVLLENESSQERLSSALCPSQTEPETSSVLCSVRPRRTGLDVVSSPSHPGYPARLASAWLDVQQMEAIEGRLQSRRVVSPCTREWGDRWWAGDTRCLIYVLP